MRRSWLLCFLVLAAFACEARANRNHRDPEEEAREWLKKMGYEPQGFACASTDSDGDGYVTCDVNFGAAGKERLLCGAVGAFATERNHGCETERTYPISGCKTPQQPWVVLPTAQPARVPQ